MTWPKTILICLIIIITGGVVMSELRGIKISVTEIKAHETQNHQWDVTVEPGAKFVLPEG